MPWPAWWKISTSGKIGTKVSIGLNVSVNDSLTICSLVIVSHCESSGAGSGSPPTLMGTIEKG